MKRIAEYLREGPVLLDTLILTGVGVIVLAIGWILVVVVTAPWFLFLSFMLWVGLLALGASAVFGARFLRYLHKRARG